MLCYQISLWALVAFTLIQNNEAATPLFIQAITSALGTIPFTAGPMTTGLVGAKLAVGSKLLYYLGFFGRRRSKPKPARAKETPKLGLRSGSQFPGGMQGVPMPHAFGGGGFPQQMGGFNQPGFFGQYPYGYDPAQLFQMLAAQGIDPTTAMQAMSFNGVGAGGFDPAMQAMSFNGGGQGIPSSQFPFPTGTVTRPPSIPIGGSEKFSDNKPSPQSEENPADGSDGEVESFFTFLRDMDDNSCISRLMCDIGANPSFLGDFSENIHGIIGSLDVLPSSGAFQYISIMETGRREGGCGPRFPQCGDAAYEIVKNIAPSVGMPQNINSETVNQL